MPGINIAAESMGAMLTGTGEPAMKAATAVFTRKG
jgi:hypothetical protein